MYRITFLVKKPDGCTDEQFEEYLMSELACEPMSEDNPLEFYDFANDTDVITITKIEDGGSE